MIIPFLDGFMAFSRIPVTWILVMLNGFIFSQIFSLSKDCQKELQSYKNESFIYTQGQVYKQFTKERKLASISNMTTLGNMAFKDEDFMSKAPDKKWSGDQIAIKLWRSQVRDYLVMRAYYPPLMFGVSDVQNDFFSTISYQFYHEGIAHFLGNILLILIVGGFLERRFSGLAVFTVYLVGGSLAAFAFTFSDSMSGVPMVGASGSLCALLGFLFIANYKEKTRLFYILLPFRKYMGFVFVPTVYWVLLLCMVEDVSGWLAQPELFSTGVAHAVHLAGFAVGGAMAFIYLKLNLPQKEILATS